jgi:hypothetical protein
VLIVAALAHEAATALGMRLEEVPLTAEKEDGGGVTSIHVEKPV